jgi:hypothetical protein
VEYDKAMSKFTSLLIKYAIFLHKDTDCIVNGFFSDNDSESPALSVYKIKNQDDIDNGSDRLYEYINNRIRLYLRILTPIENTFKIIKIYFNCHYRPAEDARISTVLPLNSINDIAKVFFTLDEFKTWDKILKSQSKSIPTDDLLEEYQNAYINFRLSDALKCRILLQIMDENIDNITHFMRILYSPSETLYNLSEGVHIIYELVNDFSQTEQNRSGARKFSLKEIGEFFDFIFEEVEVGMLDNHNIICEGNQVKIINHLNEIKQYLPEVTQKEFPDNIEILEIILKKLKNIEIDLKVMSNIAILYISDYLKSVHKINLFDNPLIIE